MRSKTGWIWRFWLQMIRTLRRRLSLLAKKLIKPYSYTRHSMIKFQKNCEKYLMGLFQFALATLEKVHFLKNYLVKTSQSQCHTDGLIIETIWPHGFEH